MGGYPVQALPGFFRFLHAWTPLRYLTDGSRALVFFNSANVGLARAILVLGSCTIGAVACGFLAARWTSRRVARPAPDVEPGPDRLAARPAGTAG